jgi:hypothetical protein
MGVAPGRGPDTDAVAGRVVICLVLVSHRPTRRGGLGGMTAPRPTPSRQPRTEWSATLVAGPVADRGAAHPSSHRAVSAQPGLRGPEHACVRATDDRRWRDRRGQSREDGRMREVKTNLVRAIAAHERRQEWEAKREARRRLRAERRADRHQRLTSD